MANRLAKALYPRRRVLEIIINKEGPGKGTFTMEKAQSTLTLGSPRRPPPAPCMVWIPRPRPPNSAIIGIPVSYRTYRRDTPPSIDRGTRLCEGDRGGRTGLVHSRVSLFFQARRIETFDESRPSQRDKMFSPSRSDPPKKGT